MVEKHSMRRTALCAVCLCLMLVLSACTPGGNDYATAAPTQNAALSLTTEAPSNADWLSDLPEGYDPATEEGGEEYDGGTYDEMGRSIYAGATPIPLDPIDLPTATPRPELTFNYVAYEAAGLGIKFEIPYDWTVDDSQNGTLIFTDPNTFDNVNASLSIAITTVANSYTTNDLKNDLTSEMTALGQYNYSEWRLTEQESRTLLKGEGFYAGYRGVLYDGTIVRGRVHMALLTGNRRITVQLNCPGWFNSSYTAVYTHFRNTLAYIE